MRTLGSTRKPLFQRTQQHGLRTLLLVLTCLVLITIDLRSDRLDPLRSVAMRALTPLLVLAELPAGIGHYIDRVTLSAQQQAEIDRLREAQLQLAARLQRTAALERENARLRALLSSAEDLDQRVLVAEILDASQMPYRQQLILNRGRRDGVYRGQALVDAQGVLGQVVRIHASTATALLITDPDHGIPVEVNRTGLQTIAIGRGDGLGLSLPFLPGNADIQVGDLLVSSSLGGRFPAGYPVATVSELRHQPGQPFMEAVAFPTARINQGRQVLLLWGTGPVSDAPAATAAAETAVTTPMEDEP